MIERIDSHQHFWRYVPSEYSWIDESKAVLKRDFLPPDLEAEMRRSGVVATVAVQASQSLEETWTLLRLADENAFIRGVVGWVPLIDPDLERLLPTVANHRALKGVRHILQDEADDSYMLRDDFNRGVRALKPYSLVYDILIFERHLPQTIEFVDRHPDQVFVLDHVAKPNIGKGELSPWRERFRELARRPNVSCKISGMVTEADHANWTEKDLRPYIDTALDAFGATRLMFGSDWPVCTLAASYHQWIRALENALGDLSDAEKHAVWAGTAKRVYRLSDPG